MWWNIVTNLLWSVLKALHVMNWHYISIVFPLRSVKVQALSIKQHSQPLTHPSCNNRHHQSFPLQEKFGSVYMSSIQVNITIIFECLIKRDFNLRCSWTSELYLSLLSKMLLRCIVPFFFFFPLHLVCISVLSFSFCCCCCILGRINKYILDYVLTIMTSGTCPVFTKMLQLIFSFL